MVLEDGGYRGRAISNPSNVYSSLSSRIRARHETINQKIKEFKAVSMVFPHNLELHGMCFHAIAQAVQMSLKCGAKLFKA